MSDVNIDQLREIIAPAVERLGYDLDDLKAKKAGRRVVVTVVADGDNGVSLDAVAEISKEVNNALESAETTGGWFADAPYTLEVSSPGIDRPLTLPRHWKRNIGRLVAVSVGEERLNGRIAAADERGIELESKGANRRLEYSELGPGKVQIELK
ncbi:ribosome maturation factor RimP [Haloglycomyces albus]|uniref:ribosome maturation factor RimP n=1 Tax=Haloglycomyces albus TaxID=526067 RepID=UPI00046CE31C|nr:ribosome maturation factor RimP [Haloglycomyces albus]